MNCQLQILVLVKNKVLDGQLISSLGLQLSMAAGIL